MSNRPTDKQVAAEIAALKKLKPFGPFTAKTTYSIEEVIAALEEGGIDETTEEWDSLTDDAKDAATWAVEWLHGDSKRRPSKGWEGLAK